MASLPGQSGSQSRVSAVRVPSDKKLPGSSKSASGTEQSNDSDSYTGDEAASDYDINKVSFPRTAFKKKGNFGRFKDIFLELDGVTLREFPGNHVNKPSLIRKFSGSCKIMDGSSLIGEENTILLIPDQSGKDKKKTARAFYKAKDRETFELWFRAIRRAVSHQAVANGIVDSGLDVSLFEEPTAVSNVDGIITQANEPFCKLFGWSMPELVGKPLKVLMPASVAQHHDSYMQRFEKTGNKRLIGKPRVMKALHRDGSFLKVLVSLGEVGSGADKKYVGTMKDIRDDNEFASGSAASGDETRDDANPIARAVDANADALKKELLRISSSMGSNSQVLQEKLAAKKQKLAQLRAQVDELDQDANRFNLSAKIARRALDMLIVQDNSDAAVSIDKMAQASREDSDEKLVQFIKTEIEEEVERAAASSASSLFRPEDFRTRKVSAFMLVVGSKYLSDTLGPATLLVRSNIDDIEASLVIDAGDNAGTATTKAARAITRAAAKLVSAITHDCNACPPMMRSVLKFLHDQVDENFVGGSVNAKAIVSGFLFLRFFVPAIVSPFKFGLLPEETVKEEAKAVNRARVWAIIGRVVQCLANGSVFPKKNNDTAATVFNKFIRKNSKVLTEFVAELTS